MFVASMGGSDAWQQVQREQPQVAQRVLRSVGGPFMREQLMKVAVPKGSGGDGVRLFDGVAGVGAVSVTRL